MNMATKQVNLAKVFKSVTKALAGQKQVLNQADGYNHDHGDNMVEVFEVVTQAVKERKSASPADQLAYAGQLLRQRESGSAKYYAGGLSKAAQQFAGKKVTQDNIVQLVQALISGGQEAAPVSRQTAGGDPLSALLGGLGAGAQGGGQSGIDIADLLNAGMSYVGAKQSGQSDVEALMGALAAGTQGGSTPYRAQSGAVVANALLQAIGALSRR
jgi:hypothetical protein